MIVRCPSCKTTYRVNDELLHDAQPAFRCSRCKHIFEMELPKRRKNPMHSGHAEATAYVKTSEEQELKFSFVSKPQENGESPQEITASRTQDLEFPPRAAAEQLFQRAGKSAVQETSMPVKSGLGDGAERAHGSPDEVGSEPSPSQPLPLARETLDNVLSLDPYRDQPQSALPFLTLFGLLVVVFGFATVFHLGHPTFAEGIVRRVPFFGASVLRNKHLRSGVVLESLHANHQTIQGNREVLVITGLAQNRNPVVIRDVHIAGQLYNAEGKPTEQQTIWIGNALSPRIIRGMTAQDIADLQRLRPLKTFEIPPGDSIPFTIVFLKSTKDTKAFSCAVLTAEEVG